MLTVSLSQQGAHNHQRVRRVEVVAPLQGPLALAQCSLFDWTFSVYPWFDGIYGQYFVALVLLLLGLGTAISFKTISIWQKQSPASK